MSSQCTCTTDKEATCIVHPTTRSLKEYIAQLEVAKKELGQISSGLYAAVEELEAENARLKIWYKNSCEHRNVQVDRIEELEATIAEMREAARQRDGSTHYPDCKIYRGESPVCNCGHDALTAILEENDE